MLSAAPPIDRKKLEAGLRMQRWLQYWPAITFDTRKYAAEFRLSLPAAYKIYTLNSVIGIAVFLVFASIYWMAVLREQWHSGMGVVLVLTAAPILLSIVSSMLATIPIMIVWVAFRCFNGTGSLTGHISRTLVCTSLEWLTAGFYAEALLMNQFVGNANQLPRSICLLAFVGAIAGVTVIRAYYSVVQYMMLSTFHYGTETGGRYGAAVVLFTCNLLAGALFVSLFATFLAVADVP
jgi:hypothetical protein